MSAYHDRLPRAHDHHHRRPDHWESSRLELEADRDPDHHHRRSDHRESRLGLQARRDPDRSLRDRLVDSRSQPTADRRLPHARDRDDLDHHHRDSEPRNYHSDLPPLDPLDTLATAPERNIPSHHPSVVPNASKIYIGGLPELTRPDDLDDCFSQLGRIKNIELKAGYGFVEFHHPQSACDAVAKYHEGTFLGSQIKVEISHGGSRPRHVAVSHNPDACYSCGVAGHWARDCPDLDHQSYTKRRIRPRSLTPPLARDHHSYVDRESRNSTELFSRPDRRHHRHRTPPGAINDAQIERQRLAPSSRESHFLPALPQDKRYRPDRPPPELEHKDYRSMSDLNVLPHQDYKHPSYLEHCPFSRSPPPPSRDHYLTERIPNADSYPTRHRPHPSTDHDGRVYAVKSYSPEPVYSRRETMVPYEGMDVTRSKDVQAVGRRSSYTTGGMSENNRLDDRRFKIPNHSRQLRGHSPRRLRSTRRSLSPPRRSTIHGPYRAYSPGAVPRDFRHDANGYGKASYPTRR